MLSDATRASELIPREDGWWPSAAGAIAIAQHMNGRTEEGDSWWREILAATAMSPSDPNARSVALVWLASRALSRNDVGTAHDLIDRSARVRSDAGITRSGLQAFQDAVAARVALLMGPHVDEARRLLARSQSLRPLISWAAPGLALPIRLELIRANLMLADVAATRVLAREGADIVRHRPGLGMLETELRKLSEQVAGQAEAVSGPSALTDAELRLVPWLATHLSFREIGERLYLSTNTVKTEALSAYRKLGVSSRSEAVEAAVTVGLLDDAALPSVLHRQRQDAAD